MGKDNEKLVLSIEEAAKLLGISRTLGYQAARTGELPTIKIEGRILISRKAIERMLDGNVIGEQSTPDIQP